MRRALLVLSIVVTATLVLAGTVVAGVSIARALAEVYLAQVAAGESDGDDDRGTDPGQGGIGGGSADGPGIESDEDFGTVEVYDVTANGALDPPATGAAADVWQLYVDLVGAETVGASILQFKAGDAPESDTLAYVVQDRDPQYWTLVVNLAIVDEPELLEATLVHEHAHVITYAETQFDARPTSCSTFEVAEGCVLPDAYLWAFYVEFWSGYPEHPGLENTDPDIAYDFYLDNEEDFVSDYAATNIGEDVAESFMTYVLEDDWSLSTPTGAKLAFFDRYPELVALRERMRAALGIA